MRKKQIGVIGSMADVEVSGTAKEMAVKLGRQIAGKKAILVYGFEGDFDSVSEMAAKEARSVGGETLAFMWGGPKGGVSPDGGMVVKTGQSRGGGREFSMIISCDGLISIGGGSGTLMEMAMAYQYGIPVVTIKGTGGWSEKLAGTFLDERKRYKFEVADDPAEAVDILMKLVNDD